MGMEELAAGLGDLTRSRPWRVPVAARRTVKTGDARREIGR
jgi:hypothetical protein